MKNTFRFWILCLVFVFGQSYLQAQNDLKPKEVKVVAKSDSKTFDISYLNAGNSEDVDLEFVAAEGKNYLLIIAVDKYKFWKSLSNPVKDARDLKKVLMEKYGFTQDHVLELYNEEATPDNIRDQFESLKEKGTDLDNLLIYYSGHGYYDPSFDLGYWVPSEGRTSQNATASYIPNDNIRNYIKVLNFRHILMVADACFSGSLFISEEGKRGEEKEKMESIKSRWGMSSGNLELVSDGEKGKNSPFATYFVKYLQENLEDRLKVSKVMEYVVKQMKNTTNQNPIGARLSGVGDEGGEFVFVLQGAKEATDK
ncbi:MAG: caspase family protein [Bacteroidetes bacterium]|nr:MAG: caspase family protein [Bacteroidota bacterium]